MSWSDWARIENVSTAKVVFTWMFFISTTWGAIHFANKWWPDGWGKK